MTPFASERHVFTTALSPQACHDRLKMSTRMRSDPRTWIARRSRRPLTGTISPRGFSIRVYSRNVSLVKPKARGTLNAIQIAPSAVGPGYDGWGGLTRQVTEVRVSVAASFHLLLAITVVGVCSAISAMIVEGRVSRQLGTTDAHPNAVAVIVTIGILCAFVGLVCLVQARRAFAERRFLLQFLRTALEAREGA